LSTNYEDVLSFFTPDEFRREERGAHRRPARPAEAHARLAVRQEIIERVTAKAGLPAPSCCTPRRCTGCSSTFWFQRTPVTLIETFTSFTDDSEPGPWAERHRLPERYVAAKFYGNTALPDTPDNRAFISTYLAELTQHIDVVLLNTADRFDDHDDFPPELRAACTPSST
jgi:hypothetical protein